MRLTPHGRSLALFAVVLWTVGLLTGALAPVVGGWVVSAALAYGLFTVHAPNARISRSLDRTRCKEGDRITDRVEVRLAGPWGTRVILVGNASAGLECRGSPSREVLLKAGKVHVEVFEWDARTWGRKSVGPLKMRVRDPLGLVEEEVSGEQVETVLVRPTAESLGKFKPRSSNAEPSLGPHIVSKPGDGMEFFALREYQPGDNIRSINWKASARSGSTMVNQVGRESFARVLVVVDLREKERLGPHVSCALVRSGRAASSILAHHERMRDHLNVLVLNEDARKLSHAANPRLGDLLDALVDSPQGGACSMLAALRANLASIRPRSPVYVVTSGALDADFKDALLLIQAMGGRPYVVSPAPALGADAGPDDVAVVKASRAEAIRTAKAMNAVTFDWGPDTPLEVVISAA